MGRPTNNGADAAPAAGRFDGGGGVAPPLHAENEVTAARPAATNQECKLRRLRGRPGGGRRFGRRARRELAQDGGRAFPHHAAAPAPARAGRGGLGDARVLVQLSYVESLAGHYRAARAYALRANDTGPRDPAIVRELVARLRTFNAAQARETIENLADLDADQHTDARTHTARTALLVIAGAVTDAAGNTLTPDEINHRRPVTTATWP